jgi:hypothetical protein
VPPDVLLALAIGVPIALVILYTGERSRRRQAGQDLAPEGPGDPHHFAQWQHAHAHGHLMPFQPGHDQWSVHHPHPGAPHPAAAMDPGGYGSSQGWSSPGDATPGWSGPPNDGGWSGNNDGSAGGWSGNNDGSAGGWSGNNDGGSSSSY